jgi:tRNA-dihydrouridine synthase
MHWFCMRHFAAPNCVQAGEAAADAGAAGLVLHARTADQQYSPPAHWEAVQQLVEAVPGLPVIGNGDVFEAADAVQMMRQTGCHGGCRGLGYGVMEAKWITLWLE